MAHLRSFLIEVTQEFLYNIVYDDCKVNNNDGGIEFRELSEIFKEKFGHRPMEYFGHHNGKGWIMFLNSSPGIRFTEGMVTISEERTSKCVAYKKFNETKIHLMDNLYTTLAQYRQILIHKACELISGQTGAVNTDVTDTHGNTLLHLIAALPCIGHEPTLVKHLLDAGFDPLKNNSDGQTIFHIIAGRMQAEVLEDENNEVDIDCGSFGSRKFDPNTWPVNDRIALLEYLSRQQFTVLANAANSNGNTAMHEWVISLSTINSGCLQLGFDGAEKEIGLKLLSFGADLRKQNDSGETPLHFAYNSEIFQFLLEYIGVQKAVICCRVRNERDETPLLSFVKYVTSLVSHNSSDEENMTAELILGQLIEVVKNNDHVCKTAWMPDEDGNSAVDIILNAVKNTSRRSSPPATWNIFAMFRSSPQEKDGTLRVFRKHLIELLERSLRVASDYEIERRSLLHVLLDLGDIDDPELLQSVELLLQNRAEVNAIDSKGRTPLDVVKECKSKMPSNSFFPKCEKMLVRYGAKSGSFFRSSVDKKTSGPNIDNRVRKILSCPKKHLNCAQLLIKNNDKVTVVKGKYRYSSKDAIGLGAFSSIFVAVKDENVDKSGTISCRAYALKRVEKARANPNELQREIKTLVSISGKHENIIKYHELLDDDNFQYLCLELMDGDLNEFVKNNEVKKALKDPVMRVKVTKQIIDGLAYLHQQKLLHRDLKPGNILYTTDPELNFKISDFGLTKNMSTLSTMTSTIGSGVAMAPGTRCWMAPELISMKSKKHTPQSDIFSLGLVLHFLLTLGKHPFATRNEEPAHVIEKRIMDAQIQIDRTLHPEAASFSQQLLNQNPSKRPGARFLHQHPFLWSEGKKIEFLKVVGAEPEAVNPTNHPNSLLEQSLQMTSIGQKIQRFCWDRVTDRHMSALFAEMTAAWKQKKYRTDKVIDLLRFIRNAYAHNQEKLLKLHDDLDGNIFLQSYPSLVLDAFGVVHDLGFLHDENRRNIQHALIV